MLKISRREAIQSLAMTAVAGVVAETSANPAPLPKSGHKEAITERIQERVRAIPLESQQIGGMLADRMRTNLEARLLKVDEFTILKGYAVPRVPVESYAGEHAGMFLDAAANALRYSGSPALKALADRVAAALLDTQGADGYLGSYGPGQHLTGVDVWIHRWNLTGLMSYYEATGETKYLRACHRAGDLLCRTFGEAPGQRGILTATGDKDPVVTAGDLINTAVLEQICRLYRFSGERRYLDFAKYIVRAYRDPHGPDLVQAMLENRSVATIGSGHAYAMLVNFNGILDLYRLTGQPELLTAVMRAWENIKRSQLYITGALGALLGYQESFQPDGLLLSLLSSNVGETCATVTWLEFNWRLFCLTGEARFGQEIERATYNQLLAAQDACSGDFAYFTALTGHKECSSDIVCCLSSGARGISLIPQWIWALGVGAFVVNLYTAGVVSFEMNGTPVCVTSQTDFPRGGSVTLKIDPERDVTFTLMLRVPEWTRNFTVLVDSHRLEGTPGQMLNIARVWRPNTVVEIRMELPIHVLNGAPSYPDYLAVQRGPQILALERSLNPHVRYLERAALAQQSDELAAVPLEPPVDWNGRQIYELPGVALNPDISGTLVPQKHPLRFVPFADAVEYRVWTTRLGALPQSAPALTAFARGRISAPLWVVKSPHDVAESLTDENPHTYCTVDPTAFGPFSGGDNAKKNDPVWFDIMLNRAETISRVVFRHGATTPEGGWFDTAEGKPRIEVTHAPFPFAQGLTRLKDSEWTPIATLECYPDVTAASDPDLTDQKSFEVNFPHQTHVYGIRIVGRPARTGVTCAELSGYA